MALASLAKGRLSGEEAVYVPMFFSTAATLDDETDTFGVAPFARGAHKAWCSSAAKGKDARGGPGLELLRAVRDESHAAALGAHRRRRRSDLFREMTRGSGAGASSDFGLRCRGRGGGFVGRGGEGDVRGGMRQGGGDASDEAGASIVRTEGGSWPESVTLKGAKVTIFFNCDDNQAVSPPLTCAYLGSAAKSLEYLVSR